MRNTDGTICISSILLVKINQDKLPQKLLSDFYTYKNSSYFKNPLTESLADLTPSKFMNLCLILYDNQFSFKDLVFECCNRLGNPPLFEEENVSSTPNSGLDIKPNME